MKRVLLFIDYIFVLAIHIAIAQNFVIPADSLKHLMTLAEHNSPDAQIKLGDYYRYKHLNGVQTDSVKAVYWYQKAAESGSADAQRELGHLYYSGEVVHQNYEKAFYWYSKAAEQGDLGGYNNLANCYEKGHGVPIDIQQALYWRIKSGEEGSVGAQMTLGYYYSRDGNAQDYAKAVYWYRKAADQGNATAQVNLGVCYENGHGVSQDYSQAVYWYRTAADQGNARAQGYLGICYYRGEGVSQDYSQAVYWYRKAADQGNALAQGYLGICYYRGEGVSQDYSQAVYWYRKSVDQGNATAQCCLGYCYEVGHGVSQDYSQAVYWYRKAADQGNASAQLNLGFCYDRGQGVSQDYTQAVYWYRKAADQGDATAQNNLGICYYYGQGVSQDYTQAVYWYRKAADQGNANAKSNLELCYQKINEKGTGSSSQQQNTVQKKQKAEEKQNVVSNSTADAVDTKIPKVGVDNDKTFAVIIANGKYMEEGVADVECAENDGRIFKEYCHRALGLPEKNVHYRENATLNQMRSEINWISQVAKAYNGQARIIFYYSGHGVPDERTASSYLLPSDGLPYDIRSAYSLVDLYDELGSLPSQYVTVFLDACFSGSQKNGEILHKAKGAVIKAKTAMPKGNMIVLSAAQGDETAHVFQQKKHGLFTYFLLKKLQESKGQVSLGDLSKYIQEKVSQYSIVEFGKSQTPATSVSTSLGNGWYQTKLR